MLKKWIALLLSTAFVLAACHSPVYNQTAGNVADVKIKAADARLKSDNDAKPTPPLVVKQGPYVDTTPVSLASQPTWLSNHIVLRGDSLPFSYYSRIISSGANSNVLTKYQPGMDSTVNTSMSYSGTVKGALDLLAARTGYSYTVHNNSINWQAWVTKTFDVAFMPGSSDYMMGKKGGGAGTSSTTATGASVSSYVSSDESDSEYSSLSGKLSIWDDLEKTITQLLTPEGKVIVSQATTSVTIRDKPSTVELIGQYITNMNNNLTRQVLVKVQVLQVQLENDYTFGINWNMIISAFHNSPFIINGNYGTPVSISTFTPQNNTTPGVTALPQLGLNNASEDNANKIGQIPFYTILFNALNQQGKTSVVTEPRVVCLNNQVSVIRIVNSVGYLASVQNTTLAGTTGASAVNTVTSQLTPGTVVTGLTLYILPRILKQNVYLQVNADLSTAEPFTTVSSGGQNATSIQVPNITEKHFNQRSVIKSGDTLILSGFRQVSNTANANQFVTSQALGGKGSQQLNTETIVLITPFILPGSA